MAKLNVMKTIEKSIGKINENYDLCESHIKEIVNNSNSQFDLICNMFRFGYMQGIKAQKAKNRKENQV